MNAAELASRCNKATRTAGGSWRACCPAHEDRSPSLTITDGRDGRTLVKCFTGCEPDAICEAVGLTLADLMPKSDRRHAGAYRATTTPPARTPDPKPKKPLSLPADLHPGTASELQRLATLRNLSGEGLRIATECGLLYFGTVSGAAYWTITDSSRRNAQARRLDGKLIQTRDGECKAKTFPDSAAGWPIGADRVEVFPCVAICEGGPDLLAAFHFMHAESVEQDWTAVCMAGASLSIHGDALPLFTGKRVRIFAHLDTAGRGAAERWERQLAGIATQTDVFSLQGIPTTDGGNVGDLNDLCNFTPEAFENDPDLRTLFNVEGGAA